jgi:uncharacterized protein (UPF0332 family)
MDARKFLDLARRMAASGAEEEWRTATSRAYYSAFHVACGLMADLGFTVPKAEQAHAYLWLRLQNSGHATVAMAGRDLNDLRRRRNTADYDLGRPIRAVLAHAAVIEAESIILALDAGAVEPVRSQITTAMKTYERTVLRIVTWHP